MKLLAIILNFAFSFLNSMQAQRFLNHIGFLLHVHAVQNEPQVSADLGQPLSPELAVRFMERAYLHQFLGMRAFYFSIPLAGWIFGPWWLISSVFLLVVVLVYLDTYETEVEQEQMSYLELGDCNEEEESVSDPAAVALRVDPPSNLPRAEAEQLSNAERGHTAIHTASHTATDPAAGA